MPAKRKPASAVATLPDLSPPLSDAPDPTPGLVCKRCGGPAAVEKAARVNLAHRRRIKRLLCADPACHYAEPIRQSIDGRPFRVPIV